MADQYGDGRMRDQMEYYRAPGGSREHARPGFGGVGWALAGAAGVAALAVLGARRLGHPSRGRARRPKLQRAGAGGRVGVTPVRHRAPQADELYRAWRDPATLPRIMGFLADIRPSGDERSEWRADGPLGRSYAWAMQITEERPGELIRASSAGGGALVTESEVRFRAAPGGRGTVATLRVRSIRPAACSARPPASSMASANSCLESAALLQEPCRDGRDPDHRAQPAARADTR